MDEFLVQSEREVKLTFHSRQFRADGWLELYSISAEARNFSATINAENPPYGASPANFFQELAENWSGWEGKKQWSALDGEYNLIATSDSLGHITLVAQLNPYGVPPSFYCALSLVVEAEQLERLARQAKLFFNELA